MEFQQVNTIQSNTHLRQLVDDHIPTITSAVSLSLLLPSKTFFEEPDDDMLLCLGKKTSGGTDWTRTAAGLLWCRIWPPLISLPPPSKEEIKNDFALFKISFFFYETKVVITSKRSILMYNKILGLCMLLLWIFLQLTQSVGWPAIRLILLFLVYHIPYTRHILYLIYTNIW